MSIGSLFSGYGGLDLAAEALGFGPTAWHSEVDPHASKILAARWPGVPNHGDITAIDRTQVEPVDVLAGGFPCQDLSYAGKGAGMGAGTRSGLWSFYADAVRVLRPRVVLVENVSALLGRGMGRVVGDLAALGYDTRWASVRASDVGAPHRRERVFIVAENTDRSTSGERRVAAPREAQSGRARPDVGRRDRALAADTEVVQRRCGQLDGAPERVEGHYEPGGRAATSAYTECVESERLGVGRVVDCSRGEAESEAPQRERRGNPAVDSGTEWGAYEPAIRRWEHVTGRPAPRPTELGRTAERLSPKFVEWLMGLPAGWVTDIDIPRNAQLKALGNGVVPQQAEAAFRSLLATALRATA